MKNIQEDIALVKSLSHGEECYIFWFADGGGHVVRFYDKLFLFEIPQYGGWGNFEGEYNLNQVEELVGKAWTWT